jgi:hypothetical protein
MARGPIPPSNNGWSNRANGNGGPRRPSEADRSDRPVLPSVNEILSGDYMPSRFSRIPYAVNSPPAVPTPEGYEDRPESPPAYSYASIPDDHQQRPLAPMQDDRSSQVPRRYGSQQQAPLSPRSNPSSWASPPRTPPAPRLPSFPPIRESVPMEPYDHFVPSPSRPRPHEMNYERAPEAMSRMSVAWPETRHAEGGDYYRAPPSSGAAHGRPSQPQPREPREFYRLPPLPYRPHHEPTHHARPYPTRRHHSFSFSPATYWDRRPLFPEDEYSPAHSNYKREPNGESRPKRRRGNLPRESTDRLRAWFDAHQEHPYPSEEVKQALMRETGLQMSRSSHTHMLDLANKMMGHDG